MSEDPSGVVVTAPRRAERRARFDAATRTARARFGRAWAFVRRAGGALSTRAAALVAWAFSPAVAAVALLGTATGCIVAGVFILTSLPWALLVGGAILFALAALLLRGMANG